MRVLDVSRARGKHQRKEQKQHERRRVKRERRQVSARKRRIPQRVERRERAHQVHQVARIAAQERRLRLAESELCGACDGNGYDTNTGEVCGQCDEGWIKRGDQEEVSDAGS